MVGFQKNTRTLQNLHLGAYWGGREGAGLDRAVLAVFTPFRCFHCDLFGRDLVFFFSATFVILGDLSEVSSLGILIEGRAEVGFLVFILLEGPVSVEEEGDEAGEGDDGGADDGEGHLGSVLLLLERVLSEV